jgi:hypothetical protein
MQQTECELCSKSVAVCDTRRVAIRWALGWVAPELDICPECFEEVVKRAAKVTKEK